MLAIVNIAGKQVKVTEGQELFVNRLSDKIGAELSFDEVLLVENEGKVSVGKPHVASAKINATLLDHVQGDKVVVFKKKRRKGYRVKNGHRQQFSKIKIDSISI